MQYTPDKFKIGSNDGTEQQRASDGKASAIEKQPAFLLAYDANVSALPNTTDTLIQPYGIMVNPYVFARTLSCSFT